MDANEYLEVIAPGALGDTDQTERPVTYNFGRERLGTAVVRKVADGLMADMRFDLENERAKRLCRYLWIADGMSFRIPDGGAIHLDTDS